jgi:hypothetical protein
MDGNEVEFLFETDGIFTRSSTGAIERIFYREIYEISFTPLPGLERVYAQMTFATAFGFRTYFYFPIEYMSIAKDVVECSR